MFDAIGGKDRWCKLKSLYIRANHTEPKMPLPYTSEIWRAIDTFEGTVISVTHDPAQAASAGRVLRLQDGKLTPAQAPSAATDKNNATGNGPSAGAQLVR